LGHALGTLEAMAAVDAAILIGGHRTSSNVRAGRGTAERFRAATFGPGEVPRSDSEPQRSGREWCRGAIRKLPHAARLPLPEYPDLRSESRKIKGSSLLPATEPLLPVEAGLGMPNRRVATVSTCPRKADRRGVAENRVELSRFSGKVIRDLLGSIRGARRRPLAGQALAGGSRYPDPWRCARLRIGVGSER
jgi:hypothetical protein